MPFTKALVVRTTFPVVFQQQVAAATLLTTYGLFANPLALGEMYEFLGCDYSYDVASTSGTFDLRVVPVATAYTGGASLLNATDCTGGTCEKLWTSRLVCASNTRTDGSCSGSGSYL